MEISVRYRKGPDGILQALLRQLTEEIRQQAIIRHDSDWVQGHQDSKGHRHPLSRPETLNINMDANSKEAYDLPLWQTSTFVPVLKAEVCGIYTGNDKITSNLELALSERWHEKAANEYLSQRYGINTEIFPLINW